MSGTGTRTYRSVQRTTQAQHTRAAVLAAARTLFVAHGYTATTVASIAEQAGVAVDTVYAAVGRKPEILRLLIEAAVSGTDLPEPAENADYVRRIRATSDPRRKLAVYAEAVRQISERVAQLTVTLGAAVGHDSTLDRLHGEIASLRLLNTRKFAVNLMSQGDVRPELTVDEVTDVLWLLNSAEVYLSLVRDRGWSSARYEAWLADSWGRLLLAHAAPDRRRKA